MTREHMDYDLVSSVLGGGPVGAIRLRSLRRERYEVSRLSVLRKVGSRRRHPLRPVTIDR